MYTRHKTMVGIVLIIVAGMCWGMTGTLRVLLAPSDATSLSVGSARVCCSGLMLMIYSLLFRRHSVFRRDWNFKGLFISAIGLTLFQFTFFYAVILAGVGVSSLVGLGAAPLIAGIFGILFFGERLKRNWYIATALAITGCSILVLNGGNAVDDGHVSILGIALAIVAGACHALQGVGLRIVGSRHPVDTVAWIHMMSGTMALPFLLSGDIAWIATYKGALCVFMLAVTAAILPSVMFAAGIKSLTLGKTYTLSLSEPLTAWLLSMLLLRENLSPICFVGVALIFLGLVVLATEKDKKSDS